MISTGQRLTSAFMCGAACLALSACGGGSSSGGGGVGSTPLPPPPPPAPTPTPTPPPPPPPPVSSEDSRSAAARTSNADAAYERGFTGKGVTIAIIDSGIDLDNPEFAGRISEDSKSFESGYAPCMTCDPEYITFGLDDVQGHGTLVTSIAAGARNGEGTHGIAYDSTILALKIASPDLENIGDGPLQEAGVNGSAVAPAIRYAVEKGAFVINMSLNGKSNGFDTPNLRASMDLVRENNRLVVQSISNFTNEDSFAGQIAEDLVGADFANKDWFLFGIGVDANLNPREFNGLPGVLADRTLAVAANQIEAVDMNGEVVTVAGNSFAAPAIAGAAALLKEYWPQLGGKEISQILLTTATDLGTPGADQVYGVGLLNIEKAFQAEAPQMGTSSANMASVASTSLAVSPAFGGSDGSAVFSSLAGTSVAVDKWGRDYAVNVGGLVGGMRSGGISIANIARQDSNVEMTQSELAMNRLGVGPGYHNDVNQNPTGYFAFRMGNKTSVSGAVNASIDSGDLVTGSMLNTSGVATFGSYFNLRQGGHTFSFGTASSDSYGAESTTYRFGVELPSGLLLGYTGNTENGSALGMRGNGAFDIAGAKSDFATVGWTGDVAGFNLTGEGMIGRTKVETRNAMISFAAPVISSGFRVKAERAALGGTAVFGITSPLKVEHAELSYTAPYAYDLSTRSLINKTTMIDLAPTARELNFEMGYARSFGRSYLSLNGAYGVNSGNVAGQQSAAAWLRFGSAF